MSEPAKKKPGLAVIIGMGKPKKEPEAEEEEAEASDEEYAAAADELFDALKNDDREAFASAFKAAVMSCK